MDNEDTVVLTPEEREKVLEELPAEDGQDDDEEEE